MSLMDLQKATETYQLYKQSIYLQEINKMTADEILRINTLLSLDPLYTQNANPAEVKYIDDSTVLNDAYAKAVPINPDKIIPAPEPEPEPELIPDTPIEP